MGIDLSDKNGARLIATAQAKGISVDAYVERLMNERDEVADIVEQAASRVTALSPEETCAKIERGFLQSERGEAVDGETFSAGLLADLDDPEHKRRTG
ncbi:MAG TPA: hypothetical protein VNY05_06815 [Candidatus Acidoferrales bacterium]|jgi:hypothetical protein|nr:hypothetical protein [Candidatus Acidoferrales bacterium]